MFFDNGMIRHKSVCNVLDKGQASYGIRWMPWHVEAKKDVANCEKPRGVVSTL